MENGRWFAKRMEVKEDGFPVLVLSNFDEKDIYLSPFRGYKFQVSKTIKGEWDLGGSEVVGLANIISPDHEEKKLSIFYSNLSKVNTEKYIFELLAKEALDDACKNYIPGWMDPEMFNRVKDSGQRKLFKEFIDASYDYILKLM